ncbi:MULTISPECIES: glycine cleavage system protein GcvH [unclassified Streptomyces]|uniref:glycine cleavage system protein GcvH n=1 Tax=unclassified Streptomyces TaxID=2593676 RepID=UPI0034304FDA
MSTIPKNLKYTDEHEWVRFEADGTATVGITDHAQKQLGDVVFVDLPMMGKQVEAGWAVGTIESVKAATEVFAPVGGEMGAVNDVVADEPEEVNNEPYECWLFKIKPDAGASNGNLLSAAAYAELIGD